MISMSVPAERSESSSFPHVPPSHLQTSDASLWFPWYSLHYGFGLFRVVIAVSVSLPARRHRIFPFFFKFVRSRSCLWTLPWILLVPLPFHNPEDDWRYVLCHYFKSICHFWHSACTVGLPGELYGDGWFAADVAEFPERLNCILWLSQRGSRIMLWTCYIILIQVFGFLGVYFSSVTAEENDVVCKAEVVETLSTYVDAFLFPG